MCPYYFKIKLFIDGKYYYQSGLGLAKNFTEAMKALEDSFNPELISIEHLELGEEYNFIFLPDDTCRNYLKNIEFAPIEISDEDSIQEVL